MTRSLSNQAAIVGIGATEFSKESGRSELQLSVEAVQHALADCGLTVADVDGLTTFTMDTSSEIAVARELGCGELRFFSRINFGGGGACATVQQAAMAVVTGMADVVVCYRGFNERSGSRFGQVSVAANAQVNTRIDWQVSTNNVNWSSDVVANQGQLVFVRALVSYTGTAAPVGLASFVFQPTVQNYDLSVVKRVPIVGRVVGEFRIEALNVFNNETYADPNLNPTSTQFGRITANNGTYMRFVTFVTKFNF